MKFVVTLVLIILGGKSFAQLPTLQMANIPAMATLERQAHETTREVIDEFAKDPNFDVNITPTGDAVIKKRTPKSPKIGDPEALKRMDNLQNMFTVSFGIGSNFATKKSYEPYSGTITDGKVITKKATTTMFFEGGVRPPARVIKRLFLGAGASFGGDSRTHDNSDEAHVHQLRHMAYGKVDRWVSGEWDVLIFQGKRQASAFSAGYYQGIFHIRDIDLKTPNYEYEHAYHQRGPQLRWRGIFATPSDSMGIEWHVVTRISTNGVVTAFAGININLGPKMWLKKSVEK